VGGGLLLAPEAEHSLESGHGRASAVEAEGELEVDLQVLVADAAVGVLQPGLEVAYHPMDAGKDPIRVLAEQMMRTLAAGLVVEAKPSQPLVSRPAIGAHDRPGGDALVDLDNTSERLPLGIDHGATQFVEYRPRRLVPLEPELALQLQGRDP